MSNNNFKDDFEKNRQSIDPEEHNKHLNEEQETNENNNDVPLIIINITGVNSLIDNFDFVGN